MTVRKHSEGDYPLPMNLLDDSIGERRNAGFAEAQDFIFFGDADNPLSPCMPDYPQAVDLSLLSTSLTVGRSPQNFPVPYAILLPRCGDTTPSTFDSHPLAGPSGMAGALLGLCLGGPLLATVAGFGSAYAVRKDGPSGDVARALGEVALSARDASLELEDKHHFLKKTKTVVDSVCESSSKDGEAKLGVKIAQKTRGIVQTGWKSIVDLNQRHQFLNRGVEETGKGFEFLAGKFSSLRQKKEYDP